MRQSPRVQENKMFPFEKLNFTMFKDLWSNSSRYLVLGGTFLLFIGAISLFYFLQPYFEQIHLERINSNWGFALIISGLVLLAIKISFLIYIFTLYIKYKPTKSVSDDKLPLCTVIVPAYNEGELVYKTLHSLAASDYPANKLEIISVDDGSKDDTWQWMQKAKSELGDRVSIYQQPENRGKRHALYRGFNIGKGEVFIPSFVL